MAAIEENPTMSLGDDLELDADGTVKKDGKVARSTDVPERWDLPEDHPLRGERVVKNVPCGMGDCVVKDGALVPHGGDVEPVL